MIILHTADLHLGKALNEYSLLELQQEMLDKLIDIVDKEKVDLVLLAGDIYDRSLPPQEAVQALSHFLTQLTSRGVQVVMIAGNHDSVKRLSYAADILSGMGLFIPSMEKEIKEHSFEEVSVYAFPYMDRIQLGHLHGRSFKNLEEAMAHHISTIELDKSKYNILMTHHYILGSAPLEESESERPLFLGNTENISAGIFKDFDYVALGHIHRYQQVADNTYYPGSPMKYSKGEASKKPGYLLVDTENKEVSFNQLALSRDLRVIKGNFKDLMEDTSHDLVYFELEDRSYLPQAMARLKRNYPGALGLSYLNLESQASTKTASRIRSMNYSELFSDFYQESLGQELDEKDGELVRKFLERSSRETT